MGSVLTASPLPQDAQETTPADQAPASFAAPVRLKAGDAYMGSRRMYPSPVMHDVNGDGLGDIVVGCIFGKVTVALRDASAKGEIKYLKPAPLKMESGKDLKFHNW